MKDKAISNKKWKENFVQRLLQFGVSIIKLVNQLPKTPAGFAIAHQLIRSATAIGANFVEAQDASSIKDFIQKLSIALREARETIYWLRTIQMSGLAVGILLNENVKEGNEIVAILISSVKSSKLKL